MKKAIYILAAALLALTACKKKSDSDAAGTPEVDVAQVEVDSVVLHKVFPGYLEAFTKAEVVGEVSGRLLTMNYKKGSYVQRGQVLFTIDPVKYRDAVQQAEATLASAKSRAEFYSQQSAAMQRALASNAVSKMEANQSVSNLRQAQADIQNATAALETARTNLAKCTVRAPISGYITSANIDPGNYVNGEGNPQVLATIYDNATLNATFSIEDSQYEQLLSDSVSQNLLRHMPISFTEPLPHSYTADLTYQAPTVDKQTGTIRLTGLVRNIDNELKDGMYVTVSLPYGVNPKAILVKDASIGTDQLGKYVYVVNDSDKVVYTPVKVGELVRDSLRIVDSGLKAGDRYVTKALLTVRNGMKVKPHTVK